LAFVVDRVHRPVTSGANRDLEKKSIVTTARFSR
jgi:hypothetical protein